MEKQSNWLIPLGIIVIIVLVSVFAIVSIRNSGTTKDTKNPVVNITITPTKQTTSTTKDTTSSKTTTSTTTASATSVTPTSKTTTPVTSTTTPQPTPDVANSDLNSAWVTGVKAQSIGDTTYFIKNKSLMKGDSTEDTNATAVYTSTSSDIKQFYIEGNKAYIVEGRDSATNRSRLFLYSLSSKKSLGNIWYYDAVLLEVNSFLHKTGTTQYYITMSPVNKKYTAYLAFENNYKKIWETKISSATAGDLVNIVGMKSDDSGLVLQQISESDSKTVDYIFPN